MNRIIAILGCMSILIFVSFPGYAENHHTEKGMYTRMSTESILFSLGEIDVQGSFYGMQNNEVFGSLQALADDPLIASYVDAELLENLHVFPVVGSSTIANISNISLIPQEMMESLDAEQLFTMLDEIEFFSNVTLSLSTGMFIIGTSGGSIHYTYHDSSCFSGFISFPFEEFLSVKSFFCLSEQISTASYFYQGDQILIYPFSGENEISIYSSTGEEIWNNQQSPTILFLTSEMFDIVEQSVIHLFPLSGSTEDATLSYTLSPSIQTPNILKIIQHINEVTEEITMADIPSMNEYHQGMQILTSLSSTFNGGIVLVNHSNTVEIDGTSHAFQNFGFTRVNQATISSSPSNVSVQADHTLVFLGDHFYSSQATTSDTGVSLPIYSLIFWIVAVISLILTQMHPKKFDRTFDIDDNRIYYVSLIVHFAGFFIAFLFVDYVLQQQLGISFLKELDLNGLTMVAGVLLLTQCVVWFLGFLLAALPIGIIISRIGSSFGFDKTYRHFFKGVTALSIWPIVALYLTMFFNMVLLFFNPLHAML